MVSSPEIGAIVPQRLKSLHPQKIAIVRRNGIGDLLMTLPLAFWCKRHLNAKLTFVCDERNRECAQWIQSPPWDELLVIPKGNKYWRALHMAFELRKRKLDLIVSAKPSSMKVMNVMLAFSGAKLKCATVDEGVSFFSWKGCLQRAVNWPISPRELQSYPHQAEQALHLLCGESFKLDASYYPKMRSVEASWHEAFERVCLEGGGSKDPSLKRLYLNVTNNRPTSRLDCHLVIETLKHLKIKPQIILGGLPSEQALADRWCEQLLHQGYQATVALSYRLPFTLAALRDCDAVLTGDGGLMHLSAACDRPQVVLFGQTCLEKWRPLSDRARCLFHPTAVSEIPPEEIAKELQMALAVGRGEADRGACR